MKINTQKLKEVVNKSIKGAGMNKIIPITTFIGIKVKNNELRLITTDKVNTLVIKIPEVDSEDFNIAVDANKFSKLISKLDYDICDLEIKENYLIVKCDGTYKLPIIADENGIVTLEDIEEYTVDKTISLKDILSVYNHNTFAISKNEPYLQGYYCTDNEVITTDSTIITFNNVKLFDNLFISEQMTKLLTTFGGNEIKYSIDTNNIIFETDTMILRSSLLDGSKFPVEPILAYKKLEYSSVCEISKDLILDTLDRLSLFIEPYDNNSAKIKFDSKGLTIISKQDSMNEFIRFNDCMTPTDFECFIDINQLKGQLKSTKSEVIELHYGDENSIKIVDEDITQIIALLED